MVVANPSNASEAGSTTSGTSFTLTMGSAPANNVIVQLSQMGVTTGGSSDATTPTDDFGDSGGGSWISVADFGAGDEQGEVWRRQVGTGATGTDITVNWTATTVRHAGQAFETTGHDTSSPISETNATETAGEDPHTTGSLGGAAAGNLIWAASLTREHVVQTVDSDFLIIGEANSTGTNNAVAHTDYDPDDNEIACTFDYAGTPEGTMFSVIVEVAIAAAAGANPKGPLGHPLHGALAGPV